MKPIADVILENGRITTLDPRHPEANEVVIVGDKFAGVDNAAEFERGPETKVIDLKGRRVIPGLYDSHLHVIRGGLNYNMELRWEGVPSLSLALEMLREQAARTPAPQWVRVVGGWSEFQFVAAYADLGRDQCRRPGNAGLYSASLLPGFAQPRGA